jgi:hypothetical protein
MNKIFSGPISFVLMIAVIIIVLKVMNWIPLSLQQETIRRYGTVEEANAALHTKDIFVPSYFPQQISWPPALILAQGKPYFASVMEFTRANTGDIALVITQSEGGTLSVEKPIEILVVKEKVRYVMKGREAVLTVGSCRNDEPCSGITWQEGKYTMNVLMKSTPFELTKIVDSMLR